MPPSLIALPPNRVRRNYQGGAYLDRLSGMPEPADSDRPEDWIASTVLARNPGLPPVLNEGLSPVPAADGGHAFLKDLFTQAPEHFLGPAHSAKLGTDLGFLMKLIDSSMRLHVQAHPTAAFAQQHLDSRWGKLEAYYVLAIRDGCEGYIRLGFQHPPTPKEWRRIVFEQDIAGMDACFDKIHVEVGSVWFVPGGLPHALGEGLTVVEILEPTDLVVRCEFEREGIVVPPEARFMQRDPDFALQIFDYTPMSAQEVRDQCRIEPHVVRQEAGFTCMQLLGPDQTDCFEAFKLEVGDAGVFDTEDRITVGVVIDGAGTVTAGDERIDIAHGNCFLSAAVASQISFTNTKPDPLNVLLCRPGAIV